MDFHYIKYGMALALLSILFGGLLGLSFGCCEGDIKSLLKEKATNVLTEKYQGKQELADKVIKKSWIYIKRAHFHSQTMGIIAVVFSLLVVWLKFPPQLQFGISFLSGFGSLGYGAFWLSAALLAPELGSTSAAKDSVEILAQGSAGPFFIASMGLFGFLVYIIFFKKTAAG